MLGAGRAALAADPRSTEMALWAMWDAAGLARDWQRRALGSGAAADRADADLDAVVALFAAAEQFTDRTTGADPQGFLRHLATQDFAADTLAARGEDSETVAVHTAASAAGLEWDLVIVAGLQEDSWPDLRIRDTLLGAQQLADLATARDTGLDLRADGDLAEAMRTARLEVLADELRAFVSACSRARRSLVLTAVLDTDDRPSSFYEMLLPGGADGAVLPQPTPVTAGLDLRGLVGELRAALLGPDERAAAAAQVLAHLHARGVGHADPAGWPDLLEVTSDGRRLPGRAAGAGVAVRGREGRRLSAALAAVHRGRSQGQLAGAERGQPRPRDRRSAAARDARGAAGGAAAALARARSRRRAGCHGSSAPARRR